MIALDQYPEPFHATGSVASEGVLNQLGRPHMGPIEVLIREAVQNCWDAKHPDSDQVRVSFDLVDLDSTGCQAIRDRLFANLPPDDSSEELCRTRRLLLISDRGTIGLGGVLRANEDGGNEPRDFVDFLRNIGQPPDKKFGGGTYGYGKVSLYQASRLRTIMVHTRCRRGGRYESRFMAARLGGQSRHDGCLYTGRHWWGRFGQDGVIDPTLDDEADEIAAQLGFPEFEPAECGTTLAIVEPDFGPCDGRPMMATIAEALVWNFWPKMVGAEGAEPSMRFSVRALGEALPIRDVESDRVLGAFCTAYSTLKSVGHDGPDSEEPDARTRKIECGRPIKYLGRLGLEKFPAASMTGARANTTIDEGDDPDCERPGLEGRCHHTALLRVPELVVKYLPGPESASPLADYAGVFLTDEALDRVFAWAEPPTHDDWVPDGLPERRDRTFVRVALRRIGEAMTDFSGVRTREAQESEGAALGALAEKLSGLFPGAEGTGARVQPTGPSVPGKTRRPRPRVQFEGDPVLETIADQVVMTVACSVTVPEGMGQVRVRARPAVMVESGGLESEAPAGAESPRVVRWLDGEGAIVAESDGHVSLPGPGEWPLRISATVPPDAQVAIDVTASSEEAG